ncbi:MAG: Arm DNA-binding domain-containing protein, partial [Kofleriaceae bacterium]
MAKVKLNEHTMKTLPVPKDAAQAYYWDKEVTGFGVVVGKTGRKTFMVRGRIAGTGERIKVKIGVHLAPRDDRHMWTVELAREKAKVLLGQM